MKKKVLILGLALIAIICCSSVVSAGFFDFLGGETAINGTLKENTINYNFGNATEGSLIDKNGIMNHGDLSCSDEIKIELDASEDDINKLNDALKSDNITLYIDTNMKFGTNTLSETTNTLEIKGADYTLDGNVLTVKLNKLFDVGSNYRFNIKEPSEGHFNITSGNITIPGQMTINF